MRLVGSLLAFLLRKVGLFLALLVVLFVGFLVVQIVVPSLREAAADRERLEEVADERASLEADIERLQATAEQEAGDRAASLEAATADAIDEGRSAATDARSELDRLRESEQDACGVVEKVTSWVLPGDACGAAQEAVEAADAALDTVEENLARAEDDAAVLADPSLTPQDKLDRLDASDTGSIVQRDIDAAEAELDRKEAEEETLERARSTPAGWVVDQWARSWRWVAGLAVLLIVLPPALRVASYFVLMPLVHRVHTPVRLADGADDELADLRTTEAQRTLTVDLDVDEVLSARSEYVRPVQGRTRSRLLYDASSPFISFAAGLYFLSRVTGDERVTSATLASPDDPDAYLMRIDFSEHPGVVIHPKHVVGVIGRPEIRTRWRWGIQALATGQVRYIMFAGVGSLVVQGVGDVVGTNPQGGSTKIEQNLVMGFDSRLAKGVNRTEVFWPYLRGREPLVDEEFTGAHTFFWQKTSAAGPSNPLTRAFDAVFSAFGKVLGF